MKKILPFAKKGWLGYKLVASNKQDFVCGRAERKNNKHFVSRV